ncbi:tRNA uridine(34) 5-carboxymethylaminomethyl modification radical SAM/GNAT enzyme Elp3 [Candidatus Micrarchaeota archaeon]|nr:tRNA uridine(34) 5-carboxymethylaminomethyl modification radical SAM/GNAT enzyme Elp3 [Candidatus Micrarchaeota archaeon]
MRKKAINYIIDHILKGERALEKIKRKACSLYSLPDFIKNSEIRSAFPKHELTKEINSLLLKKPSRTKSGVSPIAVMIKPIDSCKWNCIYCPSTGKAAKSYTGEEPAALRARAANFDPFIQTSRRVSNYELLGHPADKCEVIVMGGTFLAMDRTYKRFFIKGIYDALNGSISRNLAHAKKINETSKHRAIGLTIETRPDVCSPFHIDEMLGYGATRVELGVQHPDDRIYSKINRGHSVKDVVLSTKHLKNSAFKVCYHLMPGLPGSSEKKDIEMFKKIFSDARFKPDMLKIYPTLVMEGTKLYNMWRKGEYKSLSNDAAARLISKAYKYIPSYVRVMRIQRDIPAGLISAGVKKSNLRQIIEKETRGIKEIRYKEIAFHKLSDISFNESIYRASDGTEHFISAESDNRLLGFIRLRKPSLSHRKEITSSTSLVRELHVYGAQAEIGKKGKVQHRSIGSSLLSFAEQIAKDTHKSDKMVIISGVGAREYYYKKGYKKDGPYVSKTL